MENEPGFLGRYSAHEKAINAHPTASLKVYFFFPFASQMTSFEACVICHVYIDTACMLFAYNLFRDTPEKDIRTPR